MQTNQMLFNDWAKEYDNYILSNQDKFPFAGYDNMVKSIIESISLYEPKVLDIGIGTGVIARSISVLKNAKIVGIDVSEKMLDISQNRIPEAKLLKFDFSEYKSLPQEFTDFDYIISTYTMHHFTNEKKLEIIEFLRSRLTIDGKIIIGDIGFWDEREFNTNKIKLGKQWDEDEFYFNIHLFGNELIKGGYRFEIKRISFCAWLWVIC
jgi:putative AdoMet-dependent methyltransferase